MSHNVPVQSLIDHIKTAIDVDPWAKEMVEELLKEQGQIIRCKDCKYGEPWGVLIACGKARGFGLTHDKDWFCADGERK